VRIAIDTNILAYAEGIDDAERQQEARLILASAATQQLVIPLQGLGELFSVLRRKSSLPPETIKQTVLDWQDTAICVPTTLNVLTRATDLATDHHLNIWDAVIFAAASEAGCRAILSEDMHDGFVWGGVTLINPFMAGGYARLQQFIS
jgi:predicted nucleic acid-binding protein